MQDVGLVAPCHVHILPGAKRPLPCWPHKACIANHRVGVQPQLTALLNHDGGPGEVQGALKEVQLAVAQDQRAADELNLSRESGDRQLVNIMLGLRIHAVCTE